MSTGFGRDLASGSTVRTVKGAALLADAITRRLNTPRGALFYDDLYGFDVGAYLGHASDAMINTALPVLIENELLKDDRIAAVDVTVTSTRDASGAVTALITIVVTPADETEEFPLTLAASDAVTIVGALP